MPANILLGAIADDFTGATDLSGLLVRGGMRTVQTIGVPPESFELPECDALVVALKTRTIAPAEAVSQSRAAARWLQRRGIRQLFFKVCSTFDSTDAGNIGPVADALLDELGETINVVCPGMTMPESDEEISGLSMWASDVNRQFRTDEMKARIAKAYPLRRIGRPEDVAGAVVFLASDAAGFVTGQTLSVSGGYTMM